MNAWWCQIAGCWQSGGLLLLLIAFSCLGIWSYFLRSRELLLRTMREGEVIESAWMSGELSGDVFMIKGRLAQFSGGMASLIRMGIEDVINGQSPLTAFQVHEEECLRLLRRDFIVLAAFTTITPLLGLLGSVMGMIDTFEAVSTISIHAGTQFAEGIRRALITTQFGLVVALPGVFGLAYLQRLLRNVQVLMAECRAHTVAAIEQGLEASR